MNARDVVRWRALVLVCLTLLPSAGVTQAQPILESVLPEAGSTVRTLEIIEVQFSEPVSGVDAPDLLVNGSAATDVAEFGPGQFVFSFAQPPDGPVTVSWRVAHGIASQATGTAFAGGSWAYILDSGTLAPGELIISEFMADNQNTLHDEDGDDSDWIEIYNGSDDTVNLEGWFLTDDPNHLTKWRFPNVAVAAKDHLVVFASEKNRTNSTTPLHTNFKLASEGEYLALVSPRTNVFSEFAPAYPPQQPDISYGRVPGAPDAMGYFTRATPGDANAVGGPGFAPAITYSHVSGTFLQPFTLALSIPSTNAVLRYTLDGTIPTNSSPVYVAPIPVTNSVQVRARAFAEGLLPGPPRTETFILLSSNVVDFTSDLPVLIIHSLGKGAPSASRQNPAHLSVFEPVNGVTSLTNSPALVTRFGIKIRGSSTQGYGKSSFAVEFWDEFNDDVDREVLGLPSESDWVLYAPNNFEPVLIHNPFVHQLSRDMGCYSPRTRFVEVYLNKSTGPIAAANYNGIYVLEEKIKINPRRVAIDRLKPEHLQAPEVTGGYLLKIDRLDPGDTGFSAAGQTMCYVDPKEKIIRLPQRDPQEKFIKDYFDSFGRALNGANWLHPVQGYRAYVDVDGWIDFHVLEVLTGNVDALVLSTYFHKPRQGKIVFGPHWDFDRALGSTDGRDANPRRWTTGPFFTGWWSRLFRDPDFWQKWIDRYQELRGSYFSLAHINRLIDQLADEVRQAQPRERQKWRVAPRGGTYQSEVNLMKNWLSNRLDFIDKQLVPKPRLGAEGGRVTPGFVLSLSGPTNATVYYTLDGSDPRLSQGGVAPQALVYTDPITITDNVRVVARARNLAQRQTGGPPISSPWSGPEAATFTVRPPPLLLTELMFHPAEPNAGKVYPASDFEFLELRNMSGETLNLTGYHFTHGIEFTFSSSSGVALLAPGERVVVARNPTAFQSLYPDVTRVVGPFADAPDRASRRLALVGPISEPMFDFVYDPAWQPLSDGFGFSLVLADENTPDPPLENAAAWRLSARPGGSPDAEDPPPPVLAHVLINELMSNPLPGLSDSLELYNPAAEPADISGWLLTDDFKKPDKVRFPPGTIIAPQSYAVFTSFPTAGSPLAFSKSGEEVYLFSADATGQLTGWFHGFKFDAAEQGVSFGRTVKTTGEEAFVAQNTPTFGAANAGPRVGPVVINEILVTPQDPVCQFVELWNTGAQSVPLFDPAQVANTWRLRGTVEFDFPQGTTLPAQGYLVLVGFDPLNDPSALARFRSQFGFDNPSSVLLGPWRGRLSPASGSIRLFKPGEPQAQNVGPVSVPGILVEQVAYSADGAWPLAPAPSRLSMLRRNAGLFSDEPANWTSAPPSPGDADADGDGLPDSWELRHGLDPNSALGENGADADPDLDGLSNLEELRCGTAPRDPASALRIRAAVLTGSTLRLECDLPPGRSYTIESRDRFSQDLWQAVQSFVSSAPAAPVLIPMPAAANQRFYRLTLP